MFEKIEAAVAADFQEHFVAVMGLSHSTDLFPRVVEHVQVPDRA